MERVRVMSGDQNGFGGLEWSDRYWKGLGLCRKKLEKEDFMTM
jgi:hypothetical protein